MARILAYDIVWDKKVDDQEDEYPDDLPHYVIVCLPGFDVGEIIDPDAVTDKLSDDWGFCVSSLQVMVVDEQDHDFEG